MEPNQFAFTICQVPVTYSSGKDVFINITFDDGSVQHFPGNTINNAVSEKIFSRSGEVKRIEFTSIKN